MGAKAFAQRASFGASGVGRIIKRHLFAAMGSDPQFLFLRRSFETAFFEDFGWRLLQGTECSYPTV
jgi:hypothetical protein